MLHSPCMALRPALPALSTLRCTALPSATCHPYPYPHPHTCSLRSHPGGLFLFTHIHPNLLPLPHTHTHLPARPPQLEKAAAEERAHELSLNLNEAKQQLSTLQEAGHDAAGKLATVEAEYNGKLPAAMGEIQGLRWAQEEAGRKLEAVRVGQEAGRGGAAGGWCRV
jgi:hypothetical protein